MTGLIEMTTTQLPRVFDLIQRIDRRGVPDADWLRVRTLDDPSCLPELLLLAEEDGQLAGLCLACLRGQRGVVKLFGVEETRRRHGIGDLLFGAIEERLRQRGATEVAVEGAVPSYFLPGVPLDHTDAICFLLKRGYQTDRTSRVDMEVDLLQADLDTAEAEEGLAGEGILIRRAGPEDIHNAAAFALQSFSEGWRYEVADAVYYTPSPLFIALHDGRIISFAVYDVTGPARFGPTGTHPDYRQHGIGGVLLKLCMRDIRDRGDRLAEIGWVGPIGFYARAVGARIGRAYWCFRKPLSD